MGTGFRFRILMGMDWIVLGIGFAVSFCGGVWIGGVVYELGEAEGIYAILRFTGLFWGVAVVLYFASRMGWKEKKRELNARDTEDAEKRNPRAQAGVPVPHGGILGLETKRKMGLCGGAGFCL